MARRRRAPHGRLARARPAQQARSGVGADRARRRLRARARGPLVRPLDRLPSIKAKLGVVIVATVAGTVLVLRLGASVGLELPWDVLLATAIGLLGVQLLAR